MDTFIDQMGQITRNDGGPRIAGQILGYLLVEGEPRTLSQMAETLRISKASASTNARLLEMKGMVQRTAPVGQRGDAYQVLDRPSRAAIHALAAGFRTNADTIGALAEDFPASHAAAADRVRQYAEFYRETADFFEEWIECMAPPAAGPASRDAE